MKKLFTSFAVLTLMTISAQGAFAWTYEGLNSLNPFTGFRQCNKCEKVEKCKRPKLTKCEKLHGVKIRRGEPCGCAAPVPVIIEQPNCMNCQRAF